MNEIATATPWPRNDKRIICEYFLRGSVFAEIPSIFPSRICMAFHETVKTETLFF